MELTEVLINEILVLRSAVFGRDNAYTDWLAEYASLDEEPKRDSETDEQYTARVSRVTARRERLGITEGN